ncbi:MAG: hypothetical protein A4E55_02168 [Pelotomaculum sp. PtaU1.Bin035]|nr:MAG: hypothetical protein A4E55_02168 [Pelotomaculum sp. PtaU1.Bin035]
MQVLVNDVNSQTQQQAKIIDVDSGSGLKSDVRVWYVALEPQGSEFKIIGKGNTGEVLFSQEVDVVFLSSATAGPE